MENSRTNNSIKNLVSGMILKFITILLPFVIRTVIIQKLGMEYLGLNSLFSSILQVLSLSDLGFSIAISYYLYKPIQNDEKDIICSLLAYLRKMYFIVGLIILVIGLAIIPFLPNLIHGDYPTDINIYLLYLIYLANTVISYIFFSYRRVLLNASQKSSIDNLINMLIMVLMYVIQIVVLILFKNYYLYIAFLPISTFFINVLGYVICKKLYPNYYPLGMVSKEEKKDINTKVKALIGHKISYVIVNSTDSIFISSFLGLTVLAVFQNYFYIVSALLSIVTIIYSSISASIGNSIAFESREKNHILFNNLTFINVLLIGWMSICMLTLYQPFMKIWVGEDNMLSMLTVILLVIYFYSWKFKEILSVYKDSAGMWTLDFLKPYVISVLNLVLDIILIQTIGVNGALIATIISVSFISLPWETTVFYKRYFGVAPLKYYLSLLTLTIVVVISGAITFFVCNFMPDYNVGWFILKMIVCSTLSIFIMFCLTFRTNEFKWAFNKFFILFKKRKNDKL